MTTALIGKHGVELGCKARVGLVKRQGTSGLAPLFARSGHELVECIDWPGLVAAAADAPFDLVLVDGETAGLPRAELACPVLPLGEPGGPGHALSPAALEHALDVIASLAVALTHGQTRMRELERLVEGIRTGSAFAGHSPCLRRLVTAVGRAADCDATVLVEGPSGSGKSLAARAVHCKSRRANRTLVAVDAASSTAETLARRIEEARGSTLLVEDVDRLPAPAQATLVRHLKERGGNAPGAPRVIATTSAHLPELVARGAFREDLFYRLHALPIVVPALRERLDDLPLLARAILESGTTSTSRSPGLSAEALAQLERMPWPGNVAQLEATLRRAQCAAGGATIEPEHLGPAATASATATAAPPAGRAAADDDEIGEDAVLPFEQEEQRMLGRALRATKGNVRRAAQLLGIGRATLYRKIQQYHLRLQ